MDLLDSDRAYTHDFSSYQQSQEIYTDNSVSDTIDNECDVNLEDNCDPIKMFTYEEKTDSSYANYIR